MSISSTPRGPTGHPIFSFHDVKSPSWVIILKSLFSPCLSLWLYIYEKLGGGNSNNFYFHLENWGKISNLTHIFQMIWNHQPEKNSSPCFQEVAGEFLAMLCEHIEVGVFFQRVDGFIFEDHQHEYRWIFSWCLKGCFKNFKRYLRIFHNVNNYTTTCQADGDRHSHGFIMAPYKIATGTWEWRSPSTFTTVYLLKAPWNWKMYGGSIASWWQLGSTNNQRGPRGVAGVPKKKLGIPET